MYDVKQFDPAEWTSPPTEARIVDKPPLGKVIVGRGAVNQKGPEAAFLAALHAIRSAGKKMPVNLVLVAEGEESEFVAIVAAGELRDLLHLRDCQFSRSEEVAANTHVTPNGEVLIGTVPWATGKFGLPTKEVDLPVRSRGFILGHFLLTPTPLVPVTVNGKVPAAAVVLDVTIIVDEPDVVTDGGLKLAVTPDGSPLALSVIVPANPADGVAVTV